MAEIASKLIFNQEVKQAKIRFIPNKVVYGFEDPDAAPYFKAAGWADDAPESEEPDIVIGLKEFDIDPETVFATGPNRGNNVLTGERKTNGVATPDNGAITG